jgi:hypothetical protein
MPLARRSFAGLCFIGLAGAAMLGMRPWQYRWAFGEDQGAARSADWKSKSCTRELAMTMYGPVADSAVLARKGNVSFFPGRPGHSYRVHGFYTRSGCEATRAAWGDAQWNQSRKCVSRGAGGNVQLVCPTSETADKPSP